MKNSVIEEAASRWLVSAMDVSAKAMVLALLAGMALKLTRVADPNLRHRVWTGILIAMLALPVLSQLLPSLRLPFTIDASWLIEQQGQSVVEGQASQVPNAMQTESEAVDSDAIASGGTSQMAEPKLVGPIGDGGLRVSLQSNLRKQSQSEHELDLATAPLSAESVAAASLADVSNAVPLQTKWNASLLSVILPCAFVFWMVIVAVLLARLALALIGSFQLQSRSSSIALSDLSDLDLPPVMLNVHSKSLQLFECPRLKVPVTVGVLSPRVYLPAEWLEWTHEKLVTVLTQVKNVSGDEEVVMPLAPAQLFEGQITLADTGKPATGVKVGVWASQQEFGSMSTVNGKTDDQGKYRINPDAGIRFGVTAYPAKGEPYLAKTIDNIPWGAGLKSKTVDIALPRGVLIRGRVLDVESKAPIAGVNVQYAPKGKNPNNSDDIITGWQCIVRTGEDGTLKFLF